MRNYARSKKPWGQLYVHRRACLDIPATRTRVRMKLHALGDKHLEMRVWNQGIGLGLHPHLFFYFVNQDPPLAWTLNFKAKVLRNQFNFLQVFFSIKIIFHVIKRLYRSLKISIFAEMKQSVSSSLVFSDKRSTDSAFFQNHLCPYSDPIVLKFLKSDFI